MFPRGDANLPQPAARPRARHDVPSVRLGRVHEPSKLRRGVFGIPRGEKRHGQRATRGALALVVAPHLARAQVRPLQLRRARVVPSGVAREPECMTRRGRGRDHRDGQTAF